MTLEQTDPDRGLPDPELWEAPRRLSGHELTADWGLASPPVDEEEEDR